jgi:hypothetical protein
MYVEKDFEDQIRLNDDTAFVHARITEITPEGAEINRPDLTRKIIMSSSDSFLQIGPSVLSGSYMSALIDVNKNSQASLPAEGTIHIYYNGEAGAFCKHIKLQITGG